MTIDASMTGLKRAGPDPAGRVWRGLMNGAWRIIHRTDLGGLRMVVLRAARPGEAVPLGVRERRAVLLAALGHSNKLIGYTLGVAPSTVAGVLASAQRKLAVASRRELIELLGAAAAAGAVVPSREGQRGGE